MGGPGEEDGSRAFSGPTSLHPRRPGPTGPRGAGQLVRRKPVNIPRVPDAAEGRLPVTKARSPST